MSYSGLERRPQFHPYLLLLLALALMLLVASRRVSVDMGGDAPAYLLEAHYGSLSRSFDDPSHGWGFPTAISAVSAVLGLNEFVAALVVNIGFALVLAATGIAMAFRFLDRRFAWIMAVVIVTHPILIAAGTEVMSDVMFSALLGIAVWLCCCSAPLTGLKAAAAGFIAMLSVFVRGNGIVLPLVLVAVALLFFRSLKHAAALLGGILAAVAASALVFVLRGVPLTRLFRSGAGNLAFGILDKSGNWRNRAAYELQYPTLSSLLKTHPVQVASAGIHGIAHMHDLWLLPAFQLFGYFFIPGLLLWMRRSTPARLALAASFLSVQLTYVFSLVYYQDRYFLPTLSFALLMCFWGIRLLPPTVRVFRRHWRVQTAAAAFLGLVSLLNAAFWYRSEFKGNDTIKQAALLADAGRWLRSHRAAGDACVASTRLNIAWYSELKPVPFGDAIRAFPATAEASPPVDHPATDDCRWIAWIHKQSSLEFPEQEWMDTENVRGNLRLAFRNEAVSLWHTEQ
jgi:4-amino-4-deoxy-L-arabinose transferase-like glycosyltransferase